MWAQRQVVLDPLPRGCHLVTRAVVDAVPEIGAVQIGLAQVFLQHTSASLTLNENASPDVRRDLDAWLDDAVREDAPYWTHTIEGPDDMPAHVKASLMGPSLTLPIAASMSCPKNARSSTLAIVVSRSAPKPDRPSS